MSTTLIESTTTPVEAGCSWARWPGLMVRGVLRLAIVLLTIEIVLRVGDWWLPAHVEVSRDPRFGKTAAPNLQRLNAIGGLHLIETNSRGYRDDERIIARAADSYRIVILGACQSFAMDAAESDGFEAVLEELLPNTVTFNASGLGFMPAHHLAMLDEVLAFKPHMVLHVLHNRHANDVMSRWNPLLGFHCYLTSDNGRARWHPPRDDDFALFIESIYLVQYGGAIFNLAREVLWGPNMPADPDDAMDVLRDSYLQIKNRCAAAGAEYLAVYLPVGDDLTRAGREKDAKSLMRKALNRIAVSGQIPAVDMTGPLYQADHQGGDRKPFLNAAGSLTPAGHRVIAANLAPILLPKVQKHHRSMAME